MNPPQPILHRKAAGVVGGLLVTLAVTGFFMGLQQTRSHISLMRERTEGGGESGEGGGAARALGPLAGAMEIPEIVAYSQVDRRRIGPNAGFGSRLATLQPAAASATSAAVTNATDAERRAALASRKARRAYDGAPPVVPHPIPQHSTAACLACHGTGKAIQDRVAPKISHEIHDGCTQCHVPAETGPRISTDPGLLAALAENEFVGMGPPAQGPRAWPGAPPGIPHPTLMRSDCNSCHGPTGRFGLRTPHPDRQSCTQCHAADAARDGRVAPVGASVVPAPAGPGAAQSDRKAPPAVAVQGGQP